jgi:hypothetical protein
MSSFILFCRCRLSLEDFKPLFLQFLNRLKVGAGESASLLTMFKLTERVAAALRHLFAFAVATVLTEARQVLGGGGEGGVSGGLLAAALACLSTVLTYSRAETTSAQQEWR